MPHVAWDPDIPRLFLQVHERAIKEWARLAVESSGRVGQLGIYPVEYRPPRAGMLTEAEAAVPRRIAQEICLRLTPQKNFITGAERFIVQPASTVDQRAIVEWAKRHEGRVYKDFIA